MTDLPERLKDLEGGDAIAGEGLLFSREDGVEAAWKVVDPIIGDHDAHSSPA